jgi:hypothetical protein
LLILLLGVKRKTLPVSLFRFISSVLAKASIGSDRSIALGKCMFENKASDRSVDRWMGLGKCLFENKASDRSIDRSMGLGICLFENKASERSGLEICMFGNKASDRSIGL